MDAARKSFELAAQVRNNAEDVKNVMSDLYSWEKGIKNKEKQIKVPQQMVGLQEGSADNNEAIVPPVRSQIKDVKPLSSIAPIVLNDLGAYNGVTPSPLASPTEKKDTPLDPKELRHKEANEIKDRGNRFVKLGDYDNAINEYTQAIKMYPEDVAYLTNRALCYLKLERYDECIEDCDRATEIDNLAVKAYYRRMQANESLGNNMDALKDCTTVLMIEPKNIEANRSIERINERLRNNVKKNVPNFTNSRPNLVDILPIEKPAYKRSTKALKRIGIAEVVGPKDSKNQGNLKISDEDIDKLFNSSCGYFEEIKDPEIILKSKQKLSEANPESLSGANFKQKNTPVTSKELNKKRDINCRANSLTTTSPTSLIMEQNQIENNNNAKKLELAAQTIEIQAKEIINERPLPAAPTSTAQFYSNWKELTPPHKYQYLKSIHVNNLCRILGAGFDSDTLTDVVRTLHDFYLPHKDSSLMASTLLEISKNKQVPILSLLMSTEERKALSQLVNYLKENNPAGSATTTAAEQIMKNFNLN